MVDLIIRPSGLEAPQPKWSLQLRWHESVGETEYHTLARINDDLAEEIIRAGAASYLFSDKAEPSAPLYVLRRTSDRKLMPDFKGRSGGTYVDPDDPKTHTGTPRLFKTKKAATEALRWWAKGRVFMEGGKYDFGFDTEPDYGIGGQTEVPGRNFDDWEVVPMGLHDR